MLAYAFLDGRAVATSMLSRDSPSFQMMFKLGLRGVSIWQMVLSVMLALGLLLIGPHG